jgi:hypothetical protein
MNNPIGPIITKKNKKNKKVYQEWKGNNKFCLKGKIFVGSEYYYGLLSFFYLLINYLFYILFIIKVSKILFFNSRDLNIIIYLFIYMKQF